MAFTNQPVWNGVSENTLDSSVSVIYDVAISGFRPYSTSDLPNQSAEYAISKRVDDASSTLTYLGEAAVGSSESGNFWRIRKIDYNNPISIKWAANAQFTQAWTGRSGLAYT